MSQLVLVAIIYVACRARVSRHLVCALLDHFKSIGEGTLTRLLNVTSDHGSEVTSGVWILTYMVNIKVSYEYIRPCISVRCFNHSVQLSVLKVIQLIKEGLDKLKMC